LIGGEKIHLPSRPGDARHTLADWSQAREILGWRPEIDVEDSLAELL
jgi:UDP-glucose 4-epimerase